MLRSDFQAIARMRAGDAEILLASGHHAGAYYLAGLAIECAFKAVIAKATREFEFPDRARAQTIHTHDLTTLLRESGLLAAMNQAGIGMLEAWTMVKDWNVDARYRADIGEPIVRGFVNAALGRGGVLPWLMERW